MKRPLTAVHPELRSITPFLPKFRISAKNLWLWRFPDPLLRLRKTPGDLSIENIFIPGLEGQRQIRLRIYRLKTSTSIVPGLLWMHGGGYVIGVPEQDDPCCIQYVRESGIAVVSVDYRRAPEHPFPASLEDCYTALKWMSAQAGQIGIGAGRIAIGGSSAGGGLAAALAQLAYDRKEITPAFQLLVYPMLDDRSSNRTDLVHPDLMTWGKGSNRFGWEAYLGKKCESADPPLYGVPSRRADLAGLPPAWIGVGTLDLFHDEDAAYAQRLRDSGVACDFYEVSGAYHGFDVFAPRTRAVQEFRSSQIAALKRALSL